MSLISRKISQLIYSSLEVSGIWRLKQRFSPNVLTVLNYHRVVPRGDNSAELFKPNVSATPDNFTAQMDYVQKNYNVVSMQELVYWFKGEGDLPVNPALITFDDGYLDNYLYAFPILKVKGLSATIFLTTDFINKKLTFYWDLIAFCIKQTNKNSLNIDSLGTFRWSHSKEKEEVVLKLVETLKNLPEINKKDIVKKIPTLLDVDIQDDIFNRLPMSWDQIREMRENKIEFGSHTVSHPILSRVSIEDAMWEIAESKNLIEEEIGEKVIGFAYPNGQKGDFTDEVVSAVKISGYELAFSLISGPSSFAEVNQERFQIRRIFLSHKDSFARFAAKLNGISRIR